MYSKTIRIFMWLLMYPLIAAYTQDKVVILVAGTIAGVFAFFVTWAFQLAVRNKNLPVDRMKEKSKSSSFDDEDYIVGADGTVGEYDSSL